MSRKAYGRIRIALQILIFWIMPLIPFFDLFWWKTAWFINGVAKGDAVGYVGAAIFGLLLFLFLNWAAILRNHAEEAKDNPKKAFGACGMALIMLAIASFVAFLGRFIMDDLWRQIQLAPRHPKTDPFLFVKIWWGAWLLLVGYSLKAYWDEAVRAFASLHKKHIND